MAILGPVWHFCHTLIMNRECHKYHNRRKKIPRISLWRDGRHSNDYRFFDRRISELMNMSGTGVLCHKYLGPALDAEPNDLTQPQHVTQSELNIQDLLFLENRNRKYEEHVYKLRGVYQVTDSSFDLSQFGLFLQTGTLFMSFHINDMIDILGRRIINGDVLELEHLMDYEVLDPDLPAALKRFFVVGDCIRSAEGYSATWWPHIWRCRITPLVDSQEYKDILTRIKINDDAVTPIKDILSTYQRYININDAVIAQSEQDVPVSGYDTSPFFHVSKDQTSANYKVQGYLTGSGLPPNGLARTEGIVFPVNATVGQYHLRTDYSPPRLFRFDGRKWQKIEDQVRTNYTNNSTDNHTQRNSFVTNSQTYKDDRDRVMPQSQNLKDILKPKAD